LISYFLFNCRGDDFERFKSFKEAEKVKLYQKL